MRTFGLVLAAAILAAGAPAEARGMDDNPEDAKLLDYFRAYLDATFEARPMLATRLGDHRFDDRLDDLSAAARDANLARDRDTLAGLPKAVDRGKLSDDGKIDYDIFAHDLERSIWLAETFDTFVDDPRVYGEYTTESVYLLLTQSSLPKAQNLAHALERMKAIPGVIDVAKRTIGRPPKVKVETAILQTRGAIGFYRDELYLLAGEPKGQGELAERAKPILEALEDFQGYLQDEVLPRSGDAWRIGPERFAKKLELELDAGLTADEVLAEAESEAARVEREMATISRQLWGTYFPGRPIPPDDADGRRELVRRVLAKIAEDHGTPDSLLADVKSTVADIKAFIEDRDILALPEPDRLRIIEMPEFMRGNSVAYLNPAPPLDPSGSSEYAVSPPPSDWSEARVRSFLEEYNRAMLKVLTIHEAYPGHYVQLEYSNRCPSMIRRVLSSGTFAEGWAVYTEQTMLDQGFGGGDPALRLQQLKFYLRAVLNAILDHEMHAGSMTDEQAMELLTGRGFQSEGEAVGKIIRAKQSSAQLSTYFVGRTAFYRLRQSVQREMGDDFDLARFHEAALAHGTLPVKYLPELVRKTLREKPRP
jgi:uncharacterized protein (DUF885 family)